MNETHVHLLAEVFAGRVVNAERTLLRAGFGDPVMREFEGDPVAFVLSMNLQRRHLSDSQRAMVAAEVANMQQGGDRKSEKIKGQICPLMSLEDAAKAVSVSRRSAVAAQAVLRSKNKKAIAAGLSEAGAILTGLLASEFDVLIRPRRKVTRTRHRLEAA